MAVRNGWLLPPASPDPVSDLGRCDEDLIGKAAIARDRLVNLSLRVAATVYRRDRLVTAVDGGAQAYSQVTSTGNALAIGR